jgi:hypothetical protein
MIPSLLNKNAITVLAASALLLSACGAAAEKATPAPAAKATDAPKAAPAPTSTVAPKTSEAQQPKANPAPTKAPAPTKTAEPVKTADGGGEAAGSLFDRVTAAKDAASYEASMTMQVKGDVIELPARGSGDAPLIEMAQIKYKDDSETVMRGLFAAMFGAENGVTLRTVGGKTYVRGPAPLLGAPDDAWYELEGDQAKSMSLFNPNDMLRDMVKDDKSGKFLTKKGTEPRDGLSCDVYLADTEAVLAQNKAVGGDISKDFDRLDFAEVKLLMCEDGYPHFLNVQFKGASKKSPDKPSEVQIQITFKNYNNVPPIEAPADAKKAQNPFGGAGDAPPPADSDDSLVIGDISGDNAGDVKPGAVLPNSNDGSYKTDYPLVGKVGDLIVDKNNTSMINYSTDATLRQVYDFYVSEMGKQGYAVRKITTIVNESVVNLVMDGGDDGLALVVQAVQLEPGKVNVNVRKERV